ncbi:hypothetical protein KR067_006276 [Drosophila pandora]|nr:hypothetical protein KR067_006276 [Drosophila pandora]
MNDSSDSEYEDTEFLVYGDFKNNIPAQQLKHENAAIKVIGIESDTPMAEVNGNFYKGHYEQSVGTLLFFDKDKDNVVSDPLYESTCRQRFKYVDKSTKIITFERTYIENSLLDAGKSSKSEETDQPNAEKPSLKLNINYKEAINKFGEET